MGLLSNLFKKEKLEAPLDFGKIRVDVHSHLIPGIDDGAGRVKDALQLIEGLGKAGFKKLITTPHVMSDFYRNSSDTIRRGRDHMVKEIAKHGIQMGFDCAAEYYVDDYFEGLVEKKDLLTFGDNYVLIELPFTEAPSILNRCIFNLQMAGYKPVLAHPERYGYWHHDLEKYQSFIDKDVVLQLNTNSLGGLYGPQVKKIAIKLLNSGMINMLGSDCHNAIHLDALFQASRSPHLHKAIAARTFINNSL